MSVVTNSTNVVAGTDALAAQYNALRADVLAVEANSPPIGSGVVFYGASNAIPDGWRVCDGAELSRTTYAELFAILGTGFGAGNGSTTFNLPDTSDSFLVSAGNTYDVGETGGSNTANISHTHVAGSHTHSIPNHSHSGPSHTHSVPDHAHGAGGLYAMWEIVNNTGGGLHYSSVGATYYTNMRGYLYSGTYGQGSTRGSGVQVGGATAGYGGTNTGSAGTGQTGSWSGTTGVGGAENTGVGGSTTLDIRPKYFGAFNIIKIS